MPDVELQIVREHSDALVNGVNDRGVSEPKHWEERIHDQFLARHVLLSELSGQHTESDQCPPAKWLRELSQQVADFRQYVGSREHSLEFAHKRGQERVIL